MPTQTSLPKFHDEVRATARLAAPLAVAALAQIGMGVTDTILLGALGRDALAAGGLGASLFFTLTAVLQGLVFSVGILVAHARGARQPEKIIPALRGGYVLGALAAVPFMILLGWIEPLLLAIGEPADLARAVARYDHILVWSAPAAMWLAVQRSYLAAMNRPTLVMAVAMVALVTNGFLNYGLIHGAWGLPRMGYLGSCTASAIALWGMLIATRLLTQRSSDLRTHRLIGPVDWSVVRELAHLGWPIAGTMAVEILLFTVGALMVGVLGNTSLAAHQVAINVASLSFMVPMATGQAANVRVSYHIGAGVPAAARRAGFAAFILGVGFMLVAATVMISVPRHIALLFNLDPASAADAPVIALIVRLLAICAFFQVFDGAQTIFVGALRGFKDTRVPMMLAGFGYWAVGFPIAWALAFPMGWGATGIWWGFALGLAATAVVLGVRFVRLSTRLAEAAA